MRWITGEAEFQELLAIARDSINNEEHAAHNESGRLRYDSIELQTTNFFQLLENLMQWSKDTKCYYLVLDPDPINYHWKEFHRYPAFELDTSDAVTVYLRMLTEDPGESPADAIGTNWFEYVILAPSRKWFIHSFRDDPDDLGGSLIVPRTWIGRVSELYPYVSL